MKFPNCATIHKISSFNIIMMLLLVHASALFLLALLSPGALSDSIVVGNIRVSALSATLLRAEYRGPNGFEDRTTFMVVNRKGFEGIPIKKLNVTAEGTWLATDSYKVLVKETEPLSPGVCSHYEGSTDVNSAIRSPTYPLGTLAHDRGDCCAICQKDLKCAAWVFAPAEMGNNCWPLAGLGGIKTRIDRDFGYVARGKPIETLIVTSLNGKIIYTLPSEGASNLLYWPSPLAEHVYAIVDHPRFYAPPWGPTPMPSDADVPPALRATNGYDFTNNAAGDTYVFLLGDTLTDWYAARREFLKLTGPSELLPDFAWGTWFTFWHSYTEKEAKDDIAHWKSGGLPIDVWGLDMNWRETADHKDHYYKYPNTGLFPNFTEWFEFLHENNLRTYFNDHPFPQADQTTAKEVAFRWNGLSEWMERGLDFWWFDRNWAFSIPPPNVPPVGGWNISATGGNWEGLDNAAWGSHLYHLTVSVYDHDHRPPSFPRPITLTKFAQPNWRPLKPSIEAAESPSQHRYPVWWTGDGVDLQASTESMVDGGVHHFKPYVHSDCGGDHRPKEGGDLLRWTAHCTFGTIFRFHGADHRPWSYTPHIEAVIKKYLEMRYKMIPSLIAAGAKATEDGTPLVSRCDLFWPEHDEAARNDQYLFLQDTLVAPVFDSLLNETLREVWIPPGEWEDAWTGKTETGPKNVVVVVPYEQQPMWNKRGGLLVTVDDRATTVETQDWSTLTLEAFPDRKDAFVERVVVERGSGTKTRLTLTSSKDGTLVLHVNPTTPRAWLLRLHLPVGVVAQAAHLSVTVVDDGSNTAQVMPLTITHLPPVEPMVEFFPFGGGGSRPAAGAGIVAEILLPRVAHDAFVKVALGSE